MGLGYLIAIYISKIYGADAFGRYSILVTFAQFSVMLFSLGIPTAIVKLTSEVENFNKVPLTNYLFRSVLILLISGMVGSIIIYSTSSFLGFQIFHDKQLPIVFKYLSYFFLLFIFHNFGTQFLSGKKNFLAYGLSMFILPNLLFFAFIFSFRSFNLTSELFVLLSYLFSFATVGLFLVYILPLKKSPLQYSYKNIFRISLPILFSSAFLFISNWTDIFMLGSMVSKADVGIYNAAYKLAGLSLLIILTVNIVFAPKIAELYNLKRFQQLKSEVHKANQLMILFTLPIVILLILLRKFLLGLFGLEFLSGEITLIFLTFGFLLNAFSGTVSHILNMTDYQRIFRNLTFAMAILNIGLNFVLIPKYGISGAAISSLISQLFINVFALYYVKKHFGFWAIF